MINNTYGVSVVMEFSKQTDFSMEKKLQEHKIFKLIKEKENLT